LVCACFHFILGIFAILGGKDIERNRCSLITCLVLGIVGCTIFVIAALTPDTIEHIKFHCTYTGTNKYQYSFCKYLASIVGIMALIACIIEGIVGIVLSSVTCCHVCSCCKDANNTGVVIRQPANIGTILNKE